MQRHFAVLVCQRRSHANATAVAARCIGADPGLVLLPSSWLSKTGEGDIPCPAAGVLQLQQHLSVPVLLYSSVAYAVVSLQMHGAGRRGSLAQRCGGVQLATVALARKLCGVAREARHLQRQLLRGERGGSGGSRRRRLADGAATDSAAPAAATSQAAADTGDGGRRVVRLPPNGTTKAISARAALARPLDRAD